MVDLVRNERLKLTATIFNTIAAAVITVGVLTPLAVRLYTPAQTPPEALELLAAMPYVCICVAVALHLAGWGILGFMDNPE